MKFRAHVERALYIKVNRKEAGIVQVQSSAFESFQSLEKTDLRLLVTLVKRKHNFSLEQKNIEYLKINFIIISYTKDKLSNPKSRNYW